MSEACSQLGRHIMFDFCGLPHSGVRTLVQWNEMI